MNPRNNHQQLRFNTTETFTSSPEVQRYLAHNTEGNGVDEADPRDPDQTQEEQIRITIQLEVRGFRVENGAHKLAFLRAKACRVIKK